MGAARIDFKSVGDREILNFRYVRYMYFASLKLHVPKPGKLEIFILFLFPTVHTRLNRGNIHTTSSSPGTDEFC